jgi:hypothetical protein
MPDEELDAELNCSSPEIAAEIEGCEMCIAGRGEQ